MNYPQLPYDKSGEAMQNFPSARPALVRYADENGTASSVITLGHDTTSIEITTQGTAAAMRWVATSDTQGSVVAVAGATANYDHMIPPNTVRQFAVPVEAEGTSAQSVQGVNRGEGLYQRVAYKTQGIASVFATEY